MTESDPSPLTALALAYAGPTPPTRPKRRTSRTALVAFAASLAMIRLGAAAVAYGGPGRPAPCGVGLLVAVAAGFTSVAAICRILFSRGDLTGLVFALVSLIVDGIAVVFFRFGVLMADGPIC